MFLNGITIFLSAFLLFLVQPILAKLILPRFSGGAAIWATCLVFSKRQCCSDTHMPTNLFDTRASVDLGSRTVRSCSSASRRYRSSHHSIGKHP